ncbi:MAG: hypothetical protein AVDCRST_MAG56-3765, partial [uncultured Cytophagales bacterium]
GASRRPTSWWCCRCSRWSVMNN